MRSRKVIISLILACLAALFAAIPALAFPPLPAGFYGTVKVHSDNVPDGTVVRALIDEQVYAEGYTQTYQGNSVYSLSVSGDDTSTTARDGGREGDIIQFEVGGILANETGIWHSGTNVELNLTVSSVAPLPAPSATPSPVPTQTPVPPTQPSPTSTALAQPSPTPAMPAQSSPMPTTPVQPSPTPTALTQPSPTPTAPVQTSSTPIVFTQSSPIPATLTQPPPTSVTLVQPSPTPITFTQPPPSTLAQPSPTSTAPTHPSPAPTTPANPLPMFILPMNSEELGENDPSHTGLIAVVVTVAVVAIGGAIRVMRRRI